MAFAHAVMKTIGFIFLSKKVNCYVFVHEDI